MSFKNKILAALTVEDWFELTEEDREDFISFIDWITGNEALRWRFAQNDRALEIWKKQMLGDNYERLFETSNR